MNGYGRIGVYLLIAGLAFTAGHFVGWVQASRSVFNDCLNKTLEERLDYKELMKNYEIQKVEDEIIIKKKEIENKYAK
jgi:hypothetical protein